MIEPNDNSMCLGGDDFTALDMLIMDEIFKDEDYKNSDKDCENDEK